MKHKNKRISIFIPSFEKGGVERNILIVSKIFIDNNYIVDIVYNRNDNELFNQLDNNINKIKIKSLFNISFIHPRIMDSINIIFGYFKYLFINKRKIVVLSFQNSILAILLCRLLNIPVIARVASHPNVVNVEKSLVVKISQKLKNLFYRYATVVITNSNATSQEIKKLTKANVKTIYNPTFNPEIIKKSKEVIFDEVFNKIEGKKIITVGRLSYEKDFQSLIKAFSLVLKEVNCSLILLGEGKEKENLINLVKELNISGNVYFLGFKSNPYVYVANSNLFVLTSLYEGLPNVLIESLAVNTPVVSTDCLSGPSEILLGGEGGDLVKVGNVVELSEVIINNLLDVTSSLKKLKFAQNNLDRFSLETVSIQYLELIKEIS